MDSIEKENYSDSVGYLETEPDDAYYYDDYSPLSPNFSPDGKWILTFFKSKNIPVFQIWNTETGKQIGNNIHYKSIWAPIFSPDGQWILVAIVYHHKS